MTIYQAKNAQISLLLVEKFTIPAKYLNFMYIFLKKSIKMLLKYNKANEHVVELEKDKQPTDRPIYSQKLVELQTPKIYIKTNLTIGFIKPLKL